MSTTQALTNRSIRTACWLLTLPLLPSSALAVQVEFDLPSSIECRDVTSQEFAAAHPNLKVIEAKWRISARLADGNVADIVDFEYILKTDESMRIQDYLPNTMLESAVAEDHVEVTDASENSNATGLDAHVAYKPLLLGGSHNRASKKSESSHFQQIAPRDLVLASGTIEREHGIFFRIRPSRAASLEGGKEFMFTATVPRTWRGDLCTISCSARGTKRSVISTSVVSAGASQLQIGMYLVGDIEAAGFAEALRLAQVQHAELLARHVAKQNVFQTISTETAGLIPGTKTARERRELRDAAKALVDAQRQLERLPK